MKFSRQFLNVLIITFMNSNSLISLTILRTLNPFKKPTL